ncbi:MULTISPECIES: GNAT family N-acetyltransferase [Mammaliicoccus]|uniref:N-acetyltransferase n=1 Tax=Mammaliicoccus fleurettii TaxID=150056 RepID=A0ABS5MPJ3_9STAP|nr:MULTISPECIES: N-acetyltransferase [Mammaliicoccus]HCN61547.1 N-acetyltransferase [Staphylococcus sp.]MBL0848373.1 N-acetyltransferase [Mammaliicoccus fleurettii]MBO3063695.1 N-acetyltransferase [Mammaliicoccus fleurettii]MBS3673135.1 N-acetyltransferase [Mammaliicoccus fleurettii]MBS3697850.1 N-acetyltransferase [Mammaliicoccus fleurettii]
MTQLLIGTIVESEYELAKEVVQQSFLTEAQSNGKEFELIGKIRKSLTYNAELEVVAKTESGKILGHAMMSEVTINSDEQSNTVLALAPVSVLPQYQNKGIGKALIEALEYRAYENGYIGVVVLGHSEYYRKLGYHIASDFEIYAPFEVPDENFMFKYLWDHPTKEIRGTVHYPEYFQ